MKAKKIYHLNDRTLKYQSLAQSKRQHQYLGLPGEYLYSMPQEVIYPNYVYGRVDELYCTDEGLYVNVEEESEKVTYLTKQKFGKYGIFISYRYSKNLYLVVLCHKDPKVEIEYYQYSPAFCLIIHYVYFSQDELWEKYDNLINKVEQKVELTDMEAMDIAFISKFISENHAQEVIDSLTKVFKDAIIEDEILKVDVGVILGGMIIKNFQDYEMQHKLMGRIGMMQIEKEIDKLVYDEYGDVIDQKDEQIASLSRIIRDNDRELKSKDAKLRSKDAKLKSKEEEINILTQKTDEFSDKIKQINEIEDLDPKVKKIISSLMLI